MKRFASASDLAYLKRHRAVERALFGDLDFSDVSGLQTLEDLERSWGTPSEHYRQSQQRRLELAERLNRSARYTLSR